MPCKCYHAERNFIGKIGVCWGTKECEACSCGGDEAKCDFYDYVRERAKSLSQKLTNADRIRTMSDEELADLLVDIGECDRRCPAKIGDCIFSDSACRSAWLEWLKKEADKEEQDDV